MTTASKNSNEDELRREKRSLTAKLARRETAIRRAKRDIFEYDWRLYVIARKLEEFRP